MIMQQQQIMSATYSITVLHDTGGRTYTERYNIPCASLCNFSHMRKMPITHYRCGEHRQVPERSFIQRAQKQTVSALLMSEPEIIQQTD